MVPPRVVRALRRLAVVSVAFVVIATLAFVAVPPFRNAVRAAALVPELMGLPVRPLSAVTSPPTVVTATYGEPRPDPLVLYLPAGATPDGRLGAVVLALGLHSEPLDHPDIVRVASGIARLGLVVAIPDSSDLRASRVTTQEPRRLAQAVLRIAERPEVDPARVGLAGFSAGASMALLAAAEPALADRLAFVHAFGGYADAETLLVDVATRSMEMADGPRPWSPEPGIRRDVLGILLTIVEPAAELDRLRHVLEPVLATEASPSGPDPAVARTFTGDALTAYLLFTAASRDDARAALAAASDRIRGHLAAISPVRSAAAITAPVFLMHGLADRAIPVSHALALARELPDGVLRRSSTFGRFQHEQPGRQGVALEDVPDIAELFWHMNDLAARVAG